MKSTFSMILKKHTLPLCFWFFVCGPPTWPKFKTHKKFIRTFFYIFKYILIKCLIYFKMKTLEDTFDYRPVLSLPVPSGQWNIFNVQKRQKKSGKWYFNMSSIHLLLPYKSWFKNNVFLNISCLRLFLHRRTWLKKLVKNNDLICLVYVSFFL